MKSETKIRILRRTLVVFALWPLFQISLSFAIGSSSWRMAGWGMYARLEDNARLRLLAYTEGDPLEIQYFELPLDVRVEAERYRDRRSALGRLYRPDRVAEAFLEAYPEYPGLTILVVTLHLDDDAIFREHLQVNRYLRDP